MNTNLRFLFLALVAAALVGCATPRPVLDLASQGVVVAGQSEAELQAFVATSNRVQDQRLNVIRTLAIEDIDADTRTDFETFTADKAGMRAESDRMKLIRELAEHRAKLREKALAEKVALEEKLVVGADVPQVPKEKLTELRNALAQLAEELTAEEWLKFTFGYGKQVYEGYKSAKAKAAAAEAKIPK